MNHPWLIALSPLALGALIIGTIKACEAWGKFQYERARRIRNEKMRKFGLAPFKDKWLS